VPGLSHSHHQGMSMGVLRPVYFHFRYLECYPDRRGLLPTNGALLLDRPVPLVGKAIWPSDVVSIPSKCSNDLNTLTNPKGSHSKITGGKAPTYYSGHVVDRCNNRCHAARSKHVQTHSAVHHHPHPRQTDLKKATWPPRFSYEV
jgi:hypothetical protein